MTSPASPPLTLGRTHRPAAQGSEARPRIRADLQVSRQLVRGEPAWHIKDPLTLEYFTFSREEFAVLELLDGSRTVHEVQRAYERTFAPQQLPAERLQEFLLRLVRHGLLQGLSGQHAEPPSWRRWHPANLLAIRLPGFDLDPWLNGLYTRLSWLFSLPVALACGLLIASALYVLGTQMDQLSQQLPHMAAFISVSNLAWLAVALCVSRLLHELGHALTCKHFGGECHDAGILLLVFTPCLYCDVSDSWMAADRWQRMAISAAGILVDLTLASAALLAWSVSKPGFASSILLNIVLLCGLSTIFVNGNPLLRYDGYYILADLLDIPNLWQKSREVLSAWCNRVLWGRSPQRRLPEPQGTLLVYGLASACYRIFVLTAILLFLYRWLTPLGLRILADAIALSIVATSGLVMMIRIRQGITPPAPAANQSSGAAGPPRFRCGNVLLTTGAAVACVLAIGWLPLPAHVTAPGVLQFADAQPVYVAHEGILRSCCPIGSRVAAGDVIARLEAPELAQEVIRLDGLVDRQQQRVAAMESLQFDQPETAAQLPAARELLRDLKQQQAEKRKEQDRLTLRAPRAGTVLAAPYRPVAAPNEELPEWHGHPAEPRNLGCLLTRGSLLCWVGDADALEAVVLVDDAEVGRVATGSGVLLLPEVRTAPLLRGRVTEISQQDLHVVPAELTENRDVATRQDAFGQARPLEANFQLRVPLAIEAQPSFLVQGIRCRARLAAPPESALRQTRRWLQRNFF